jgi:mannonate dehydratase
MPIITGAKVIVTCPGRNFITLKIETDEGVYGLGDATLNGRELSVASYLQDHVIPCLIGRDAHRIEDIWQYLYKGAYWRRGPVTMTAIAAVDMALWDIKGKIAGLPLYQLLGGASREGVMVYGHANGTTIEDTINVALDYQAGLQGDPPAMRRAGHGQHLWRVEGQIFLRARRCRPADGKRVEHVEISARRARAVQGRA